MAAGPKEQGALKLASHNKDLGIFILLNYEEV